MVGPPKHNILERLHPCFQAKPDDMWRPLSKFLLHLLLPQVATPVVIPEETPTQNKPQFVQQNSSVREVRKCRMVALAPWRLSSFEGLLFKKVQSLRAAETVVGMTTADELQGSLSVEVQPLRLQVGTQRASLTGTLIWRHTCESQVISSVLSFRSNIWITRLLLSVLTGPLQHVLYGLRGPWHQPALIRVLQSQDERTTVLLGKDVVVQSRAKAPEVQKACSTMMFAGQQVKLRCWFINVKPKLNCTSTHI